LPLCRIRLCLWRHDTQHNDIQHTAEHCCAKCQLCSAQFMVSVIYKQVALYAVCHSLCWMPLCWVSLCWIKYLVSGATTFSIMTFNITILSILQSIVVLSVSYARRNLWWVSHTMPSVIMLNVVILSVVAPCLSLSANFALGPAS
jgi:hypothetical protein